MRTAIANLLSSAATVVRDAGQTIPHPFDSCTKPGETNSAFSPTQTASDASAKVADKAKKSSLRMVHFIHMEGGNWSESWVHFDPSLPSPNSYNFKISRFRYPEGADPEKETMPCLELMDALKLMGLYPREALEKYIEAESQKAGDGKHLGIGLLRVIQETNHEGHLFVKTIIFTLVGEDDS